MERDPEMNRLIAAMDRNRTKFARQWSKLKRAFTAFSKLHDESKRIRKRLENRRRELIAEIHQEHEKQKPHHAE